MSLRTLVFGAGWMGRMWADRVPNAELTHADVADQDAVAGELDRLQPDRVVNAAGKTGRPNVDSLESEAASTYRSNVIGALVLAAACHHRGIHLTHLGSGCIYSGDNGGRGFSEEDPPNFQGSLYARTKQIAETALGDFDVLQLRIRLPAYGRPHPRNLLTKLLGYPRIIRVPNSITVLEDAWPVADALVERAATGVWNLVNDGAEHHDELLALYRNMVDEDVCFEVVEERALGFLARRSNCILSTAKLHAAGLALPPLDESLPGLVRAYGAAVAC